MGNPNDLAMNMVTFLPLAVMIAIARGRPASRAIAAVIALLMMATIVFTKSRAGLLGLAAVLAMIVYRRPQAPAAARSDRGGRAAGGEPLHARLVLDSREQHRQRGGGRVRLPSGPQGPDVGRMADLCRLSAHRRRRGTVQELQPDGSTGAVARDAQRTAADRGRARPLRADRVSGADRGRRSGAAVDAPNVRRDAGRVPVRPTAPPGAIPVTEAFRPDEREWMRMHTCAMSASLVGWLVCAQFASVGYYWTFYYLFALIVAGRELARDRHIAAHIATRPAPSGWRGRRCSRHDLHGRAWSGGRRGAGHGRGTDPTRGTPHGADRQPHGHELRHGRPDASGARRRPARSSSSPPRPKRRAPSRRSIARRGRALG